MPPEYRPSAPAPSAIGFRELRQACEISALKEELERLRRDTGALRRAIGETVERVRLRFSALTPEEMSDPEAMLPLLQFAVTRLIAVRDRARDLDLGSADVDDEGRLGPPPVVESPPGPSTVRAVPPPPARPAPAVPSFSDFPQPVRPPPSPASSPLAAAPRPQLSSAAVDWLAPKSNY